MSKKIKSAKMESLVNYESDEEININSKTEPHDKNLSLSSSSLSSSAAKARPRRASDDSLEESPKKRSKSFAKTYVEEPGDKRASRDMSEDSNESDDKTVSDKKYKNNNNNNSSARSHSTRQVSDRRYNNDDSRRYSVERDRDNRYKDNRESDKFSNRRRNDRGDHGRRDDKYRKNYRNNSRTNDRRKDGGERHDRKESNRKNYHNKPYEREQRSYRSDSRDRNERKRRSKSREYVNDKYSNRTRSRSRSSSKNRSVNLNPNTVQSTAASSATSAPSTTAVNIATAIATTNATIVAPTSALAAFTNPPIVNTLTMKINNILNGNSSSSNSSNISSSNISYDQIRRNVITNNKVAQLEKMGIDLMAQNKKILEGNITIPSYYNPGIVNPAKYAEQVQKRKLLWGNKKIESVKTGNSCNADNGEQVNQVKSSIPNKWENAKFSDDKVASKFMRLMGIKDAQIKPSTSVAETGTTNKSDMNKKQEELFSTMEQQYEVARQVTHTMRGVGLGFGSQPRQF